MDALVEQALRTRPELKQSQALLSPPRAREGGRLWTAHPLRGRAGVRRRPGRRPGQRPQQPRRRSRLPGGLELADRARRPVRFRPRQRQRGSLAAVTARRGKAQGHHHLPGRGQPYPGAILVAQIALAERNLATTTETLRLTRERKQYGVGIVLEDIQAQQDLERARADYFEALAEFNKAQYRLAKAVGALDESPSSGHWNAEAPAPAALSVLNNPTAPDYRARRTGCAANPGSRLPSLQRPFCWPRTPSTILPLARRLEFWLRVV